MSAARTTATPLIKREESPSPKELLPEHASEEDKQADAAIAVIRKASTDTKAMAELLALALNPTNSRLTYAHIHKNPARYMNTPWKFTGRILEIHEDDVMTKARISVDYYGSQQFLVLTYGQSPFIEGDMVDVLGLLTGPFTYQTQANWTVTIPSMIAVPLLKRGEINRILRLTSPKRAAPSPKTPTPQNDDLL